MTATETASKPLVPKLDFAPVIQGVFGVLKRNFGVMLALAALLQGLPLLLLGAGAFSLRSDTPFSGAGLSLGGLGLLIGSALLAPALVHGAVADLNGRKPTVSECIRSGLRHAIPVFFIAICTSIAAGFGMLLFIVPGIMILIAWSVAGPVRVLERTGVFASLGRSAELTRGSRWRIFWIFVLWFIVSGAVQQTLFGLVGVLPGGAASSANPVANLASTIGVVALVTTVVSTLVSYIGLSVIYYELRRVKEGIGPEALASIFD